MPCGCACGEASREEALAAPLLDLEKGLSGHPAPETPAERDRLTVMMEKTANRVAKFIFRGLLILLWVHLFNSMKRHAINYIGEDTWFCTFVVIVAAVPMAEAFCILGQSVNDCIPPRK